VVGSSTLPVLVLVTGEPLARAREIHGSWATLIERAGRSDYAGPWAVHDLRGVDAPPEPSSFRAAVVTGSAASVTERAPWMLAGEAYLRELVRARVPTFGICFGHQMLGQALGGRVEPNPRGREIGTVDLEIVADDELFDVGSEAGARRPRVNMTHVDTVAVLPSGARVLARTAKDPHAAVRFGEAAWGVQFHPEIDRDVMRIYLEERRELIRAEGGDPEALLARVDEGAFGRGVLGTFLSRLGRTR